MTMKKVLVDGYSSRLLINSLSPKETGIASIVLLVASLFVWFRIVDVLPTVFGDELIYQEMSYSQFTSNYLGNILFTQLYAFTASFGIDSYFTVKLLNLAFLYLFGLAVYSFVRRQLGFVSAVLASSAAILSPVSVYASFFMPEIMFFALVSVFFSLFTFHLETTNRALSWSFLSSAVILSLSSLVKPHSLFLLLPVVIALLISGNNIKQSVGHSGLFSLVVVGLNISMTLVLAPPGSTPLFGDYLGGVFSFLSSPSQFAGASETSDGVTQIVSEAAISPGYLLLTQLIFLLVASLAVAGVPLGLLVADLVMQRQISFSLVVWSTMLVIIAGFTTYVTLGGDDHSDRALLRYFEWVLIFAYLEAISTRRRQDDSFNPGKLLFVLGLVQVLSLVILLQLGLDFQVSDSVFGAALALNVDSPYVLGAVVIIFCYLGFRSSITASKSILSIFTLAFVGMGLSAQQFQINTNSSPVGSDNAGIYLFSHPEYFLETDLVIVGSDPILNQSVKFWSRAYEAEIFRVERGRTINVGDEEPEKFVVTVDGVTLEENDKTSLVVEGEGFLIYQIIDN